MGHANNLRVVCVCLFVCMHVCEVDMAPQHARRHIANLGDDTLKDIVLVVGRAGRSRVALQSRRERFRRASTEGNTPHRLIICNLVFRLRRLQPPYLLHQLSRSGLKNCQDGISRYRIWLSWMMICCSLGMLDWRNCSINME